MKTKYTIKLEMVVDHDDGTLIDGDTVKGLVAHMAKAGLPDGRRYLVQYDDKKEWADNDHQITIKSIKIGRKPINLIDINDYR